MQSITQNDITQAQHDTSKAVDYAAVPDPNIYAPEDGTIVSYGQQGAVDTPNDAGLSLRMNGAKGLHQFAHTEKSYVSIGQQVKRGQAIAKMGWTGYVKPPNPNGAHCHWWILRDKVYYYPPSQIDESFIKLGEKDTSDMLKAEGVTLLYQLMLLPNPSQKELEEGIGQNWFDLAFKLDKDPRRKKAVSKYQDYDHLSSTAISQLNELQAKLNAANNGDAVKKLEQIKGILS